MNKLHQFINTQGIELFSIIRPQKLPVEENNYKSWINNKYNASMKYLEEHADLKFMPDKILPGCKSIITAGLNYNIIEKFEIPAFHGRISKYAQARDYHKVLGKKLRNIVKWINQNIPSTESRGFTDAVPLHESAYAVCSGLGFKGYNSLVINPLYGSWFFIGEILTTAELPESAPAAVGKKAVCSNCQKCIEACPSGAIVKPYVVDASKCISYLTIEYDGVIPESLRPKMQGWIFGCDICQSVCPYNKKTEETAEPDFRIKIAGKSYDLEIILKIKSDEEFVRLFAGTSLMRAKRVKLIRNACIAAVNLNANNLLPVLHKLSSNKNNIIKEHAEWAVKVMK